MKNIYLLFYADAHRMTEDRNTQNLLIATDNIDDLNKDNLRIVKR